MQRHNEHECNQATLDGDQNKSTSQVVKKGYTEFFSWGNDEDGQLGHGHDGIDRKKIFNLPKSLSFEVIISQVSCGAAHTSFISSKFQSKFNYSFIQIKDMCSHLEATVMDNLASMINHCHSQLLHFLYQTLFSFRWEVP